MAFDRCLTLVEPQIGLALVGILTVAVKTVFREDRADVSIEVDRRAVLSSKARRAKERCQQKRPQERQALTGSRYRGMFRRHIFWRIYFDASKSYGR
jgi:hypothetical protein